MTVIPLIAIAAIGLFPGPAHASGETLPNVDVTWGVKIPLRDGVKLNATLYKPSDFKEPPPVIFTLTPYVADSYHDRALFFSRHGYVFVIVDSRGRGNSGGNFEPMANEGKDGHDIVEWIAKQPWCNGKVGLWGGSYGGYNQWATAKEFPPHLTTIVPAASAHPGVDFPAPANIFASYLMRWRTLTAGLSLNTKLFQEADYWNSKFYHRYARHIPFHKLDEVVTGNRNADFQKWLKHRHRNDSYWTAMVPSTEDYAKFEIPILTITGHYDGDQLGAMAYYHRHMKHGNKKGKDNHYLIMGPWDHAGTRMPSMEFGGMTFSKASILDMNSLHKAWYDWTMKDKMKPPMLHKRVIYYTEGAEHWQYATSLDHLRVVPKKLYLHSSDGKANDAFRSGTMLIHPANSPPAKFTYDPLDVRPGELEKEDVKNGITDQRYALNLFDNGLVYHSSPFPEATELTGYFKFVAWIALDVPDTDFYVSVFEIQPDGKSIILADDRMRARYRQSLDKAELVKPGAINKYEFTSFHFFSRQLQKGSRLRVLFKCPSSIFWEKNFNSGGEVSRETDKDARTAHVTLYQDEDHASYLEIPVIYPRPKNE